MIHTCDYCGQEFYSSPIRYGGTRAYCSKKCHLNDKKFWHDLKNKALPHITANDEKDGDEECRKKILERR